VLILATLLVASPARASEVEAETCLRTKVWAGYTDGWGVRTMATATLVQDDTSSFLVTLYRGNEYQIQTCGDEGIKNLDVYLYDLDGKLVARDSSADREPSIATRPEATSTFYVVLHARELTTPGASAGVAMAVTYR
jgi:hypothetical protein